MELISRVFRPYLFLVTVTGQWPHPWRRQYKIAAPNEDSAAIKGLQLFVKSCQSVPLVVRQQAADLAPKAKLD